MIISFIRTIFFLFFIRFRFRDEENSFFLRYVFRQIQILFRWLLISVFDTFYSKMSPIHEQSARIGF